MVLSRSALRISGIDEESIGPEGTRLDVVRSLYSGNPGPCERHLRGRRPSLFLGKRHSLMRISSLSAENTVLHLDAETECFGIDGLEKWERHQFVDVLARCYC